MDEEERWHLYRQKLVEDVIPLVCLLLGAVTDCVLFFIPIGICHAAEAAYFFPMGTCTEATGWKRMRVLSMAG